MRDMSRYPVEVNAVGLVQHNKQKLYMFSVLWSDCNNILIYRTYESFKDHTKLLAKKFPLEAGVVNKAERILPILRAESPRAPLVTDVWSDSDHSESPIDTLLVTEFAVGPGSSTAISNPFDDAPLLFRNKFSNRYLERLRLLEIYSKELLQTDSKISQCGEVIQFFSPNKQDLTPSFPENSIVIMPSDRDQKQKEVTCPPRSTQPNTTQPIISEAYICIDAFKTTDTKNRSFKVKKNQCIDVLIKDPSGWWLVENEDKCIAWFPAPYLRKLEYLEDYNSERKSFYKGTYYYADKGYEAQHTDEISLTVGVVVEVIEKSEIGWWLICYNGRFGYVPSMFLKPYKNPHHKLQIAFEHQLSESSPNLSKLMSNLDTSSSPQQRDNVVRGSKGKLQRMKSISLDGINDLPEDSDPFAKPNERRNVYMEWKAQDAEELTSPGKPRSVQTKDNLRNWKDKMENADQVGENQRKDSGFQEHPSPKISVSSYDANPTSPTVPERPTMKEIQSKCTSITKKAALQDRV